MKKLKRIALAFCFVALSSTLIYENANASELSENLGPVRSGLANTTNVSEYIELFNYENYENKVDLLTLEGLGGLFFEGLMRIITVDPEITFDRSRTITGTLYYGANVRFISIANDRENFVQDVVVGPSGVFSVDVPLVEGVNTIFIITFTDDDYEISNIRHLVSVVRRLPESLRESLGNRTRTLNE